MVNQHPRLAPPSAVNPPDGLGRTPLVNLPEPGSQVAAEGTSPTRKAGTTTLDNIFYGVSCPTSAFCMAVGTTLGGTDPVTLTETWSGKSWKTVSSPNQNGATSDILYAVSCSSDSFCMAVGFYLAGSDYLTLVEEWDGTSWTIVPSADPAPAYSDVLAAVSCVSPLFCVAAGGNGTASGDTQTLIEEWTGSSSWASVGAINPSGTYDDLQGISCITRALCWAVGQYISGPSALSLTETWNGTSWNTVGAPKAARGTSYTLQAVSCPSISFCVAAGYDQTATAQRTLIDRWTGNAWVSVTAPSPRGSTASPFLAGVSCASITLCAAVGYYSSGTSSELSLIEMWDGQSWSTAPSTNPGGSTGSNYLMGASCKSSTFCVAAGFYGTATSYLLEPLTERWTGSSWRTLG